jgi:hypothetical protein
MSEEIKGPGFTIKDHRHTQKTEDGAESESKDSANSSSAQPESIQDFKIDFSTFILSLTSSAFYHLGEIPDPKTGEKRTDLSAVKQTIDIISMLKTKTEGNLSDEEKKLIEQLTYELQVKYVNAQNKNAKD